MPVLNFQEIPEAHTANGMQDTFELFTRDFLEFMGFKIILAPDRGADGGKDLIVEETRSGICGETKVRWLVSCKHKATSGNSVTPRDEANVSDRVRSQRCDAFLGIYSTVPSAGLNNNLEGLGLEYAVFDREKIEGQLLQSVKGLQIAERYFPNSLIAWKTNNPQPAQIYADQTTLECHICGKDLLTQKDKGIITIWQPTEGGVFSQPSNFEHVHWTCRGHCDRILRHRKESSGLIDGWDDIGDVVIPTVFIKWVMTTLNQLHDGDQYSDEAFDGLKQFLLVIFQHVARHLSAQEQERMKVLAEIPVHLGGMGY